MLHKYKHLQLPSDPVWQDLLPVCAQEPVPWKLHREGYLVLSYRLWSFHLFLLPENPLLHRKICRSIQSAFSLLFPAIPACPGHLTDGLHTLWYAASTDVSFSWWPVCRIARSSRLPLLRLPDLSYRKDTSWSETPFRMQALLWTFLQRSTVSICRSPDPWYWLHDPSHK